jgi:hypothetical protein
MVGRGVEVEDGESNYYAAHSLLFGEDLPT